MQILELAAKLQSVGFSEKQAKVYVAALFLGPSAVQKIASQAEINRATAYVILDELAQMGIVSESTEGKKTVFVAEPPEAISRYLEAQSKALDIKKDELKDLMPQLHDTSRSTDGEDVPAVRFYKGLKGSDELSRYTMRKAKRDGSVYGLYDYEKVVSQFPESVKRLKNASVNQRVKKNIQSKIIYSTNSEFITSDRKMLREAKQTTKPVTADINLYPDRVSMITYQGEKSVGVLIESKDIAEALRVLFELAFESKNVKKT